MYTSAHSLQLENGLFLLGFPLVPQVMDTIFTPWNGPYYIGPFLVINHGAGSFCHHVVTTKQ